AALANYLFTAIAPAPGEILWAVGDAGWDDSVIARSATDGRTWTQRRSGTQEYLFGVDFTDATHGWVCGAGGTLLRSSDAGKRWQKVITAPRDDLFALDFSDASHGWVAANDERYPNARLEYTSDAGAHWESQYTAARALLYSIDVVSDSEVWAAGGDPAGEAGMLVHGGLGGAWSAQWSGPQRLADVTMVDATHGWAVGDGGLILHTADGSTWTPQASGVAFDLTAVSAVDDQTAWAVGDGETILRTSDGGAHWIAGHGDVVGPEAHAPKAASAGAGGTATLRFRVSDASVEVRPTVKIRDARGRLVKSRQFGWVTSGVPQTWTFRCTLPCGTYRFSVYAVDAAGNHQANVAHNTLTVSGSQPATP
ncbi:MAG: YCF48-related protein, partial [Actinobacteria bacterium]|nr:YCF48-related protein [Actinomycetota bacterium]